MPSASFQIFHVLAGNSPASGAPVHEDEPEDGAGGPGGFAALFLSPLAGHARDSGGNSPPGHCGKGAKFAQTPKVEDAAPTAILDAGVISTALQTPASIITSDAGAGGGEEMTPPELGDGGSSIRALPDVTTSGAAANTPTPVAKANTAASMTDPAAPAPAEHDDAGRHIAELAGENTGPHPPEDAGSSVARAMRTDAAAQSGIKAITQTDNIAGADPLAQQIDPHGKSHETPAFALNALDRSGPSAPTGGPVTAAPAPAPPPAIEVSIRSVRHDAGSFEFRLDPPDLGRLIVQISATDTDNPRAMVFADDAQTLELMRRHGDMLSRELERQGFTGLSLNFSERRDHGAAANMVSTIIANAPADWADEDKIPVGHPPLSMNAGGYDRTV